MKKLFLFSIIISFSTTIFAQTFGGGVFAGLSASQIDGDTFNGYHKAGLVFGAYTNTVLNQYIDAQLEIKYIQKGSNSKNQEGQVPYQAKLNYIELPLFLKYNFLNNFSANIGVTAGYLQKSTEDKDGFDMPADPEFNKFEFSGLAGIEYRFYNSFYFNVRFNYSILPIRSHPGDQTYFLNQGQYNNILTFAVYYQISNPDARSRKKGCDCPKWGKRKRL